MGNAAEQSIPLGLCFVLTACCCSGFASVYFEKIVKQGGVSSSSSSSNGAPKKKASVWVQNAQLAAFTVALMALASLTESLGELSRSQAGPVSVAQELGDQGQPQAQAQAQAQ